MWLVEKSLKKHQFSLVPPEVIFALYQTLLQNSFGPKGKQNQMGCTFVCSTEPAALSFFQVMWNGTSGFHMANCTCTEHRGWEQWQKSKTSNYGWEGGSGARLWLLPPWLLPVLVDCTVMRHCARADPVSPKFLLTLEFLRWISNSLWWVAA
jgi:hypothetical protein